MKKQYIYLDERSKMPVELNFYDPHKNLLDPQMVEFKLVYKDRRNTTYIIQHTLPKKGKEGKFINCYLEQGKLFARFENTRFTTGALTCELWIKENLTPEKGDGFTQDKMICVLTEPSAIQITRGLIDKCEKKSVYSGIGTENIIFPSVEYTGLTAEQSEIIVNDFIRNKQEIVKAINDKGGNAEISDSVHELADKVRELVPAEPVFQSPGNLNPYWTSLSQKIGEHYREDRKYCWAFSFLGENVSIELTGGHSYICSDGYETETSTTHTFGKNLDESKKDNWVIIYTHTPVYNFISGFPILGATFYNTSSGNVKFQNTIANYITHEGKVDTDEFTTLEYMCQNVPITYFMVPEGAEKVSFGPYSFHGCPYLQDILIPQGVKELSYGTYSFNNASYLQELSIPENLSHLTFGAYSFYTQPFSQIIIPEVSEIINLETRCFGNIKTLDLFYIKESPDAAVTLATGVFYASNCDKILIGKIRMLNLGSSLFQNGTIQEISIENPTENFSMAGQVANTTIITFELGNGWNWAVNLSYFQAQSIESMVQNCEALADRTGQTKLTLTYGATKLAALREARPDIIELAQAKNWNLA